VESSLLADKLELQKTPCGIGGGEVWVCQAQD